MGIFFSNRQKKSEMFTSNCHIARNMFRIEVDVREDHDLKHALTLLVPVVVARCLLHGCVLEL